METVKQYLKTLMLALLGRNPFREELDELHEHYQKVADRVSELNDLYLKSLESLEEVEGKVGDYQKLTENLRQRIAEKDALMERIKKDYQQRIEKYVQEVDRLRGELAAAKKTKSARTRSKKIVK